MTRIRTTYLTGAALDWAVAKADQPVYSDKHLVETVMLHGFHPSTDGEQGGAIIERERYALSWSRLWQQWEVPHPRNAALGIIGPTPLIAAMRCYVASKLGDEVDVPEELLE